MWDGRLDLTICTRQVAWKDKISNALVSVLADAWRGFAPGR